MATSDKTSRQQDDICEKAAPLPAVRTMSPRCKLDDENKESSNVEEGAVDVQTGALEQWNESRIQIFRVCAALFSFVVMGMNDASLGVSLRLVLSCYPYILS